MKKLLAIKRFYLNLDFIGETNALLLDRVQLTGTAVIMHGLFKPPSYDVNKFFNLTTFSKIKTWRCIWLVPNFLFNQRVNLIQKTDVSQHVLFFIFPYSGDKRKYWFLKLFWKILQLIIWCISNFSQKNNEYHRMRKKTPRWKVLFAPINFLKASLSSNSPMLSFLYWSDRLHHSFSLASFQGTRSFLVMSKFISSHEFSINYPLFRVFSERSLFFDSLEGPEAWNFCWFSVLTEKQ